MTDKKNPPSRMTASEKVEAGQAMLLRHADDFTPTKAMYYAKSRLLDHMTKNPPLPGTITPEYIATFCGSPKATEWIVESPEFVYWILDKDIARHRQMQLRDLAVDVLESVAMGLHGEMKTNAKGIEYVSPTPIKDKVKAAELLLEYTDAMPGKVKERWLDADLGKMDEAAVDRKLEAARKSIAGDAYSEGAGKKPGDDGAEDA